MSFGYFDDAQKVYVITDPRTPATWINYIGTIGFGGFVDQTGGALICKGDPALNRIIKYIPQLPNGDFKGETLYIRIKVPSGYKVFSPFYVPTLDNYDRYECRVGLGYMKILSEFYGIRTEAVIFVPMNQSCEIRDICITNLTKEPIELDVIPVVEYTHFDALKQLTNADWVPQTMQSKIVEEDAGYKILTQYAFMNKESRINYFTSNYPISSFESDRKIFLGNMGYGTWKCPKSLYEDELSNYEARRGDNIGALMHHIGILESGEHKEIITQLGQAASLREAMQDIQRYRDPAIVNKAFIGLKEFWENYLSKIVVDTPDAAMNTMLNMHNPRQCYITKNWSRYLSQYQLGFGARGIGFRDSAQDVMGILGHAPEEGRELIEMLLHVQNRNGSAMHQFNPVTMEASAGDSREMEDRPKYYSDDHLWIVLAVCAYIKETGNTAFLSKQIPFYEKDKEGKPLEWGSVLEHLKRGIEFTKEDCGVHGLPLLGFADWNDTVNLPYGAESVFTANLYGTALKEMVELLRYIRDEALAQAYEECYVSMKKNVNQYCWDGKWYIRYFDHHGQKIGSNENEKGKIYANAQSWSVISGFAPYDRAAVALQSVNRILNTRNGIKLSDPGYDGYDSEKGGITTYPPGAKENGGIFLHSNPWVMMAETMLGNGDQAFAYYNQINPVLKNDVVESYECEPYCYPQNILGDEHPQFGLARNSWLSGTASWVYQASVKYILGVRPNYEGLMIDPCIPSQWKGFRMRKHFRNAVFEIDVKNPEGICKGIKQVLLDGKEIEGQIIPVLEDGKVHNVQVIMG
ncbi:GH36-type glycosyl hydrolase domain-containing protein [Geosporobacter ferrireducens]|uniref:GH36-type glycosyl hydrolase domain-containing protein n=1 Tax=Geosporobacter ferrireducens TaxID=1424294 RepID=UPI00139AC8ED|nr:glycosyl transferase [Geosporobacter ferrireducens]MTI56996.1 glycosyl transferase [Geosporobacter ferrireducens]